MLVKYRGRGLPHIGSMKPASHRVDFDPALMARYDVAAPRYTSYPTAPQFRDDFGEVRYRDAIRVSNEVASPRPLSLYVHMPFCWSPCFYCGCNRIITHDKGRADRYLQRVYREVERVAPLFDARRPVRQLHLGGGTPNFLDADRLRQLLDVLKAHFAFGTDDEGVEAGIEIDPRFTDAEYVRELGAMGFNRISIGVQDFDPRVQAAVNRLQTPEETRVAVDAAREAGFASVNIDLIYGLPRQSPAGFLTTLHRVIGLAPDRLAVYGYAHLPHLFKAQGQIDSADLPDAAMRVRLFGLALETLCDAGYVYVGMDHFARPGDDLVRAQAEGTLQRNFQGYSTRGDCDIVGLGVSAIGRIRNTYSQNVRDLAGYALALDNDRLPVARGIALDRDDIIRRAAIGELMCHGRLDFHAFGERHGIVFADYFADAWPRLRRLEADGLLELSGQALCPTPRGRLLLRVIAMCFDAYLADETPASRPRHARSL
jgi:oxygen-independent coproporphyrinogen-3 oxidase